MGCCLWGRTAGESPLLSRSGGEKGLRGSGAGTLGVPLVMHAFCPGSGLTAVCLPASRDPAEHLSMIRIIKRGVARKALKEVDG